MFFLLPDSGFGVPNPALILIATNVRMEIPELVPSNSRRNTSKKTFEKSKAATIWQQVAALKPAILNKVPQMAENLPADIRCNILIGHNAADARPI
jgi:hypothetical protein